MKIEKAGAVSETVPASACTRYVAPVKVQADRKLKRGYCLGAVRFLPSIKFWMMPLDLIGTAQPTRCEALPDFCENVPNCVLAEKAALACNLSAMRRFPAPWSVEALDGGFKIMDANGQSLAYVYGHADPRDAQVAKALTLDEARRIASNIAKLPKLLAK